MNKIRMNYMIVDVVQIVKNVIQNKNKNGIMMRM